MSTDVNVAAGELLDAELKLIVNKIKHDAAAYRSYVNQMANEESSAYHERLAYRQQRCKHAYATISRLFVTQSKLNAIAFASRTNNLPGTSH